MTTATAPVDAPARAVVVPRQASPVDAAPAPAAPAAAPLLGRDRPLDADERLFVIGSAVMFSVLSAIIVTCLVLSVHVWG